MYEHDTNGRVVASVTESEWDQEQIDLLVAEDQLRRLTGPNGEYLPDATSASADPNEYSGYRYVATGPHINWAEKTRLDAIDAHRKKVGDTADLNGTYWTVDRLDY